MRLFVGAYPARERAGEMLELARRFAGEGARMTGAEQLHLTLLFIGEVGAGRVGEVMESVERSASGIGAVELRARRLVTLPRRGDARLVALETDAPGALVELQGRLARRLAARPEKRAYVPHLTLCRFAGGARVGRVEEEVELAPLVIDRVRLMRSVLGPGGAVHEVVGEAMLV